MVFYSACKNTLSIKVIRVASLKSKNKAMTQKGHNKIIKLFLLSFSSSFILKNKKRARASY